MSGRLLFLLPLMMLVILAGFFGWSLLSGRDPASIGSVMVGRAAPRLAAPALREGEPALTEALLKTGKPVLLNFFASWCTPCLAEHPLFTRLKEREGATIIGIAWKDKPEATRFEFAHLEPYLRRTAVRGKSSLRKVAKKPAAARRPKRAAAGVSAGRRTTKVKSAARRPSRPYSSATF